MFNVIGEPIDGKGGSFKEKSVIHRRPPTLEEQSGKIEILESFRYIRLLTSLLR